MKKIFYFLILLFLPIFIYCKDNFKEGNKKYFENKFDEALKEYSEFLNKNPDYYEGYYNAGNAFFRKGEYDKALEMYNKALQLKPNDEDIKHNIEVAKRKMQEKQQNNQQENKNNNQQNKNNQNNESDKNTNNNQKQAQNKQNENNKNEQKSKSNSQENVKKAKPNVSEDEMQAILNMMQKQEKQLRQYYGNQNRYKRHERDFPDFFNMTPEEIMEYMHKQMMEPFEEFNMPRKKGNPQEKDW